MDLIPPKLNAIDDADFGKKPNPEKWSKKEILGHLIDSATNNHQRFVRVQFENAPGIWYDQNKWVEYSHYADFLKEQLIGFWIAYNKHLLLLIKNIPGDSMKRTCNMKDGRQLTLAFLITDYVDHLEHHLKQIISY